MDAAYDNPASHVPTLFEWSTHPLVECWFKSSATHLLDRVDDYLQLLDRYGVAWERIECDVFDEETLYEDEVQLVVATSAS
jgi:hypothetical protein